MTWTARADHTTHTLTMQRTGDTFTVTLDGRRRVARVLRHQPPMLTLCLDGARIVEVAIAWADRTCLVTHHGVTRHVTLWRGTPESAVAAAASNTTPEIRAPMPGRVVDLLVAVGDSVRAGQPVCVIEAMKMQNELCAPGDGTVTAVCVEKGTTVEGNTLLMTLRV